MFPRKVYSGASQYVPANTIKTLHTGPGKVLSIHLVASVTTAVSVVLYDNTTNAAPILLAIASNMNGPVDFSWPPEACPVFSTGLTAVTSANSAAHIITEAA